VGQAVVGHRVGEEIAVTAPSGIVRFRIENIQT
jgi:transcription elongation GreA/GreB family factor